MNRDAKIFLTGHRGLVGSAILRRFQEMGYTNLITRTHAELDLTDQAATYQFFAEEKPEYVILAAAYVGGIVANNSYPADFIRINLQIETNSVHAAYENNCKRFMLLGSSCIYPKHAPQPMKEEHLLTGKLEPTNDAYAIAKIAGVLMCQAYYRQHGFESFCLMPTNLYGPGDNFDLETSHVMPAFIRKFHEAKLKKAPNVTIWGTGTPKREFLHVDDVASAVEFVMNEDGDKLREVAPDLIFNVGVGDDIAIKDLALQIKNLVGYDGDLVYDTSKPDGTPRKLMDVSRLHSLGWKHIIELDDGILETYEWFKNTSEARL
ncbi:GDP-L-fucose synthase [bacterium]|nr:GDP-L-fucose synthase [bacterium]